MIGTVRPESVAVVSKSFDQEEEDEECDRCDLLDELELSNTVVVTVTTEVLCHFPSRSVKTGTVDVDVGVVNMAVRVVPSLVSVDRAGAVDDGLVTGDVEVFEVSYTVVVT